MSLGSAWMTQPDPDLAQQMVETVPGMAHFAGTGPKGATCRGCVFLKDLPDPNSPHFHRSRCERYFQLTGQIGGRIEGGLKACRYFESRAKAPVR